MLVKNATNCFVNKKLNELNGMKEIIKVVKSPKNRIVLLKRTTENIKSQEERFVDGFHGPLIKYGLLLIKKCTDAISQKCLRAALSGTGAAIQMEIQGSGTHDSGTTTLITSNEEMKNIMKTVPFPEESGLLILVKQLKRRQKNKKVNFVACY